MTKSVAQLCEEQKIGIDDLVEKSSLDRSRVAAIVEGRWTPSPQERRQIASVFGVEPSDITWGHKTPIQQLWGHGPS